MLLQTDHPDVKDGQPNLRDGQSGVRDRQPDTGDEQPHMRDEQPDVTGRQHDVRDGQPDLTDRQPNLREGHSDLRDEQLRDGQPDMRDEKPDQTDGQSHARNTRPIQSELDEESGNESPEEPDQTDGQPHTGNGRPIQSEFDEGSGNESPEDTLATADSSGPSIFDVQLISAANLEAPTYHFGDFTRALVFGKSRLERVYAEVQLGAQREKSSKVATQGAKSVAFASEPLSLLYYGEEEFMVRVHDYRGMQPTGDALVGEAVVPLSLEHRDGKTHSQVVTLRPSGEVSIRFSISTMSAREEDSALEHTISAKFCNRVALQPWSEEFASLPYFGPERRGKVVKFGFMPAVHPDETKVSAVGKYKNCIVVLQAGVPDRWKSFAWHHCSGAAALSRKLSKESSSLEHWYHCIMLATFGEEYLPEGFAKDADGAPPLFNQGIEGVGGHHVVLEKEWPLLVKMLTDDGLSKAKRVLWTLNAKYSASADFCPWVPPMALAFLTFCTEHETYAALHCLLARAGRNIQTLPNDGPLARIFLFRTREQFSRVVQQFVNSMQIEGGAPARVLNQLCGNGVDVHTYIAGKLSDCLASLLPARAFLRLMGSVLIAGWKVASRYLMALLHLVSPALEDCADAASSEQRLDAQLVEQANKLTGGALDEFVDAAFKPALQSRRSSYSSYEANAVLVQCPVAQPAWPRGAISSLLDPDCFNLLDLASLISLWSGPLPLQVRDRRLQLVFTPPKHGYSLNTLASCCDKMQPKGSQVPMLLLVDAFLVAAGSHVVLGAYSPCLFKRTAADSYIEEPLQETAFVFVAPRAPDRKADDILQDLEVRTRSPIKHYMWSGANDMLFRLGSEKLLFGGPTPAIFLNASLDRGSTSFCESFDSCALLKDTSTEVAASLEGSTSVDFCPSRIEVFAFVDD